MFWQDCDSQADARIFITSEGADYSFSDVFSLADKLYEGADRSVVAILCGKNVETVIAYLGALRNNLIPLLLDANLKPETLKRSIDAYRPEYMCAPGDYDLGVDSYNECQKFVGYKLYRASQACNYAIADELALLIPTSGSTGDPKCVRLSQNNLASCVNAVCDYLSMGADRCSISLLPLHYSYGLSVLHNAVNSRSRFVLTSLSVIDRDFWKLMEKERVTDLSGVPFIYETMRRMSIPASVMSNLVCVTQAGGRLQPRITNYFVELFASSGVDYFTMYGQTEAAPRISYLPPERALEKLGSVGVPISCGEAFIAETLESQGEGELLYKGPNVCLGYAASCKDLSRGDEFGGMLKTGDQVNIDADGFISIVGRRKRFVKVQGISVNLDHMETVLKTKGVDCSVVGKENKLVVCYKDNSPDVLKSIVNGNFNFHPSTVKLVELSDIPLNSSGKTDYNSLSETYL